MNMQKTTLTTILMIILTMSSMTAFSEEDGNNQQEKDRMRWICQNDCEQATFNQSNPSQNEYNQCISACNEKYPEKK